MFIFKLGSLLLALCFSGTNKFSPLSDARYSDSMPARIIGPNPVTREVLDELIQSGIREGETLDYKRAINVGKSQAKLELCADVASFANASGGGRM